MMLKWLILIVTLVCLVQITRVNGLPPHKRERSHQNHDNRTPRQSPPQPPAPPQPPTQEPQTPTQLLAATPTAGNNNAHSVKPDMTNDSDVDRHIPNNNELLVPSTNPSKYVENESTDQSEQTSEDDETHSSNEDEINNENNENDAQKEPDPHQHDSTEPSDNNNGVDDDGAENTDDSDTKADIDDDPIIPDDGIPIGDSLVIRTANSTNPTKTDTDVDPSEEEQIFSADDSNNSNDEGDGNNKDNITIPINANQKKDIPQKEAEKMKDTSNKNRGDEKNDNNKKIDDEPATVESSTAAIPARSLAESAAAVINNTVTTPDSQQTSEPSNGIIPKQAHDDHKKGLGERKKSDQKKGKKDNKKEDDNNKKKNEDDTKDTTNKNANNVTDIEAAANQSNEEPPITPHGNCDDSIDHNYDVVVLLVGNQYLSANHLVDLLLPSFYLSANLTYRIETAIEENYRLFSNDTSSQLETHIHRAQTIERFEHSLYDYIILQDDLIHPFYPQRYRDGLVNATLDLWDRTCDKTNLLWMETWPPCLIYQSPSCYQDPEVTVSYDDDPSMGDYYPHGRSYAETVDDIQSYYRSALQVIQNTREDHSPQFDVLPVGDAMGILAESSSVFAPSVASLYADDGESVIWPGKLSMQGSYLIAAIIFSMTTRISPLNAPVPPITLPINRTHTFKPYAPTGDEPIISNDSGELPDPLPITDNELKELQLVADEAISQWWRSTYKNGPALQSKSAEEWIVLSKIQTPDIVGTGPFADDYETGDPYDGSKIEFPENPNIDKQHHDSSLNPDPIIPPISLTPDTYDEPEYETTRESEQYKDTTYQQSIVDTETETEPNRAYDQNNSSISSLSNLWTPSLTTQYTSLFWVIGLIISVIILYYIARSVQRRRAQELLLRRRGYDDGDLAAFKMEKAASATYQYDDGL